VKKYKVYFWISTGFIFLMEGVMPALTSQTELAKEGISHLGYPQYFGNALVIFKVLGVLALVIPNLPKRIKEWAYAGFVFDFLFASISHGLKQRNIKIKGLIFNGNENLATENSIINYTKLPVLLSVNQETILTKEIVAAYAKSFLTNYKSSFV